MDGSTDTNADAANATNTTTRRNIPRALHRAARFKGARPKPSSPCHPCRKKTASVAEQKKTEVALLRAEYERRAMSHRHCSWATAPKGGPSAGPAAVPAPPARRLRRVGVRTQAVSHRQCGADGGPNAPLRQRPPPRVAGEWRPFTGFTTWARGRRWQGAVGRASCSPTHRAALRATILGASRPRASATARCSSGAVLKPSRRPCPGSTDDACKTS